MKINMKTIGAIFIFLAAASALFAETPDTPIIEHGPRNSKLVAVTFDACPTSLADEYDEKVVEVLLREKVPATIFMSGRWVEKNPEKAKFLADHSQFETCEP